MKMTFRALLARERQGSIATELVEMDEADLMQGEVTIAVEYSTVNYKDGIALNGPYPVIKQFPLIPGIDLSGTVVESADPRFVAGARVVANSWGLGQTHHGGYGERARLPGDWLVPLPDAISTRTAMALGTAGYTAMLSLLSLEDAGITPERGPVIVTGASGGVGSVAITLLASRGYYVTASTGKPDEADYLCELGASEIIDRFSLSEPGPPMQDERWAGAIDSVGSHTLANVLAQMQYDGHATCCGLAQGIDLPGSLFPFIQRNITLAGIDSVRAPQERRIRAWHRLAEDLDQSKLELATFEIGLAEAPAIAKSILQGAVRGRCVVNLNR